MVAFVLVLASCSSEPTGMAVFQDMKPFTSIQDIEDGLTVLYEQPIVLNLKESTDSYDKYVGKGFEVYEVKKPFTIGSFARDRVTENNNRILATSKVEGMQSEHQESLREYTWGVESWFLMVFVDDQMLVQHAVEDNNLYMQCGKKYVINVKPEILDNPDLYWKEYAASVVFPAYQEAFDIEKPNVMYYMRRLQRKC